MEIGDSTFEVVYLGGGSHFQKGGQEDVLHLSGYHAVNPRVLERKL